jgi:hypothetical protein
MAAPVIMAAGIPIGGITTGEVQREGNHPLPELRHRAPVPHDAPVTTPRSGGVSLTLFVKRLFRVVKPKLMTLSWRFCRAAWYVLGTFRK